MDEANSASGYAFKKDLPCQSREEKTHNRRRPTSTRSLISTSVIDGKNAFIALDIVPPERVSFVVALNSTQLISLNESFGEKSSNSDVPNN